MEIFSTFLLSDKGPSLVTLDFAFVYIFSLGCTPTVYAAHNMYNYSNYLRIEVDWEDGEDVIART